MTYEDVPPKLLLMHVLHGRPPFSHLLKGDYSKGKKILGWEPTVSFKELVRMMVDADLKRLKHEGD